MKTLQEDILSKLKKIKEEAEETKDGCGSKHCKNCRIQNKKMAPDCFEKNDVRKKCFNELISTTTAELYYSVKKSRRF